jgi:beta-RFAP synthase
MITVQAPSRLHFGLFSLATEGRWPNFAGEPILPARQFGGVGLMVESPAVSVRVEPADFWTAKGPLADRALEYGRCLADKFRLLPGVRPHRITIEHSPGEHTGLGSGTQLGLSVARALVLSFGLRWDDQAAATCARLLGRGNRSALGIHGFLHGGFLVEGGKAPGDEGISPLLVRGDFPEEWRVMLAIPSALTGRHGQQEREAFERLLMQNTPSATTDALCRLVLLGMLPALRERDLPTFGEALYDFNRRVGEMFAAVQGGPYADTRLTDLVTFLRERRIHGVGQSSWGPTVFAIVEHKDWAARLAKQVREHFRFSEEEVICTAACNSGARVTVDPAAATP